MLYKQGGHEYAVEPKVAWYAGGNIAIVLESAAEEHPGEDFGVLTVNLDILMPGFGFLDTGNLPGALEFVLENGLGSPTGTTRASGFSTYPLVEFDMERLAELDPEGVERYMSEGVFHA